MQPDCTQRRPHVWWPAAALSAVLCILLPLCGCDKASEVIDEAQQKLDEEGITSSGESDNSTNTAATEDTTNSESTTTNTNTQPPEVPTKSPQQITDEWNATAPENRTDQQLGELASLDADLVAGVELIDLSGSLITDAGMAHLAKFTNLTALNLTDVGGVTDSGFAALAGLTQMRYLMLTNVPVGDEGVANLANMTQLQDLRLDGTKVTDAGIAQLNGLNELQKLVVKKNHMLDGSGFAWLKLHPMLTTLDVTETEFGRQGFEHLENNRVITEFLARDCKATNDAVAHLKNCKALVKLDLGGNADLSDEAVSHISTLGNLEELHLDVGAGLTPNCLRDMIKLRKLKLLDLSNITNISKSLLLELDKRLGGDRVTVLALGEKL